MRNFLFTAAAVSAVMAIACSDTPEADYPQGGYGASYPQGGYGAQSPQGGYGAQTPQGGAGAQTATGGAAGAAPTGGAGGTASNQATPILPAAASAAAPLLKGAAQKETAGMKEDGPAMAGSFQQGQILEQAVQIQPGRCYTVVGIGIGITELDAELVLAQPPLPEYVAATDSTTGPQAVLGGGSNCFKNPLPVGASAKLRIKATAGSGIALAQMYSK